MSVQDLISVIGCIIGVAGFLVAFFVMWNNRQKDVKTETKEQVEVHASLQSQINTVNGTMLARLDAIDSGVRDIKAEYRSVRAEIGAMRTEMHQEMNALREEIHDQVDEVKETAQHAVELAQAAHRRLDRAGIEKDMIQGGSNDKP